MKKRNGLQLSAEVQLECLIWGDNEKKKWT